jgi:uncharacterized membrane protein (DUF4010 family)
MATFIQFAFVAAAIHPPSLALLAAPLAAGLLATVAVASLAYLRARDAHHDGTGRGSAFNLPHATLFALGLAGVTAAVGLVNEHAGAGAAQVGAALAGFADAHAAGAAMLALAADGRMPMGVAAWTCLLGISTNTASKLAVAFAAGGAEFGLRVGGGLLAALAAAWIAAYAAANV